MRYTRFVAALLAVCTGTVGIGKASPADAGGAVLAAFANGAADLRPISLSANPNYLAAIRYIDAGMRYVDAFSGFFVTPYGEMCFRQLPNSPLSVYDNHYSDWCAYPAAIGRIETRSNGVELWCRHAYPQCARRLAYPNLLEERPLIADSITIQAFPPRQERAALEDLVFTMDRGLRAW